MPQLKKKRTNKNKAKLDKAQQQNQNYDNVSKHRKIKSNAEVEIKKFRKTNKRKKHLTKKTTKKRYKQINK